MPATTPHTGVRTFLDRIEKQPFVIADMSTIGGAFTAPNCDRTKFPVDRPVHFTTDDAEMVAAVGASGTLKETIDAVISEGVVASIAAVVPDMTDANTIATQMGRIVGDPGARTGLWALLDAQGETGAVPDILIAPGFTSQRLENAANPAATALDAISETLLTAVAICDTPSTNKIDSVEWAADFAGTLNIIACGQAVRVYTSAGAIVTRPSSPHLAALMVKTDKEAGGPWRNPGNQDLKGVLGPNRAVNYAISDPDCEANYMIQRGVNSLVQITKNRTSRSTNSPQGKTFWGFFNTSEDPLWRAINVVRTRKAIREVIPRTLVRYAGRNLGAHLVTTIAQGLQDFLDELKALPEAPILGGNVTWPKDLNSNATLRVGGLVFRADWEEAPPVTDIQVYTGRYEKAFDILRSEVQAAMRAYNVTGQI